VTTEIDNKDVHKIPRLSRPLVVREIEEILPQAVVDKSAAEPRIRIVDRPEVKQQEEDPQSPKRCRFCFGPMPCEKHDGVLSIGIGTRAKIEPLQVITSAHNADLDDVVIIGYRKDGSEYFSASAPDAASVMFHCQRAIHKLNMIMDEIINERQGINDEPPDAA
jgi:hypothetical protein